MMGTASAQSLRSAQPPAELPPSSFTANQFVDSRGCVFVRAGIGGTTQWVPRVSRTRDQLCGFQPSLSGGTTVAAAPEPVPAPTPEPTQVASAPAPAPAPIPTSEPAPVVQAAAPAPAPVTRVTPTVTSTPPRPAVIASPSPRVITAPAPTPQPRILTKAEACAGLTGIQQNMISQRTGEPIDCGGAPAAAQVASVAPSVQQPAAPTPATQTSRLTRQQACADMAATGRSYVSAVTGLPITCAQTRTPGQGLTQLRADLALPQQPYSNPLDAAPGSTFVGMTRPVATARANTRPYSNPLDSAPGSTFVPGVNTQLSSTCGTELGGLTPGCSSAVQTPTGSSRATTTRAATVTRAQSSQGFLNGILGRTPPPYSNPTTAYALPSPTVPDGYERVWSDGRLNTQRGIPVNQMTRSPSDYTNYARYAQAPVVQPTASAATTTRAVAPQPQRAEQISGHRYVQVGTYGTRNEAQAIARSLRSRGLPMRVGVFNQNGREMRIVLAGPFANDSQLQNALGTTRGAGFSSAFTRR
ncbi:SPOR domain-containing protein [Octadecabacter sp. B2R22]|nr:SPOR domain-containing protein [Octadecabacter sp. B2R22]